MTHRNTVSRSLLSTSFVLAATALSLPAAAQETSANVWFGGLRAALPEAAPSSAPPDAAPQADLGAEAVTPVSKLARQRSFVPVLRAGFATGGKGEVSSECEGDFSCSKVESSSYDEADSQMIAADFLWHTSPKLRLGFGTSFARPKEKSEGNKFSLGSEVGLYGVVEGVFPTSDSFAFTLRGQIGGLLLIPGDDLSKSYDAERQLCRESTYKTCNTGQGPFVGRSSAIGFGARFTAGPVAFRLDVMGELYSVQTHKFEVSDPETNGTITAQHSGLRSWLLGGIEL